MEIVLRLAAILLNIIGILLHPVFVVYGGLKSKRLAPLKSDLLKIPAVELAEKIRHQQVKSEDVVQAYIQRLKQVNFVLNAIIEERFVDAIADAKRADELCSTTSPAEIAVKYPLLGIPFTAKESCGVKGMHFAVGSLSRQGVKSTNDGDVVERLKAAGGILLLISATPEYCISWETNSLVHGYSKNPYDTRRSPGGSSGGEGALNGAGASLFGIGSDLAGSIRIPALFNGVFGHKPTGGIVSIKGHFPNSSDPNMSSYLQIGPMTRFAKDLPLLLHVMAGDNAHKLNLTKDVFTKEIKIFYLDDYGLTLTHTPVNSDIKLSIIKAVKHFKGNGLEIEKVNTIDFSEKMEILLSAYFEITDVPDALSHPDDPKRKDNVLWEMARHVLISPQYTFASLFFILLQNTNGFMSAEKRKKFVEKGKVLRQQLLDLLGNNGVLFFPTFHCPAFYHKTSVTNIPGVPYSALFNIFGFPATHIPMGLSQDGLPTGFQVVAAPYQDKLCFTIAEELEAAFGGWVPPPCDTK